MKNGGIPNGNIEASCYYSYTERTPKEGRLNGLSFWACGGHVIAPWIQADIGYQTYVSGVITQGDGGNGTNGRGGASRDWVTSLKVSTFTMSTDDQEEFVTDEEGNIVVSCVTKIMILIHCVFPNVSL